ncbi:MAG: 1-(5-phosphoribosyl)-5-[(5-phosphoribosylamino)methylideneamino]imidazole-4-carboxamide isomerase [Candidatus Omnitrophica bacterium]|nr:1-(5-phosphoribosyl)-5-[(5-phosphoribosylamino)methylideneamino]imidazole-4-carboxamide isomerase [Candidatus Omnitrophota bacterium]
MVIIPAIDLMDGKVVRLVRGDPAQSKVYSENPTEVASRWQKEGASLLHLVDLSAAFGDGTNIRFIKEIIRKVKIKVEVGGGIRNLAKAQELVSLGVERIIIGTGSLSEGFLQKLIKEVGADKIAVSIDVKGGYVATHGWQKISNQNPADFIASIHKLGLRWVIYTDISRDGMLQGPNLEEAKSLASENELNFILSGGVASLGDLKKIKEEAPCIWGVIVGKALYEGTIDLRQAIEVLR